MATTSIGTTTPLQLLANTLLRKYDTNADGTLSGEEFLGIVTQLTSASAAASPPAVAATTSSIQGEVQRLLSTTGSVANPQALGQLEPQLNALGITLQKNSAGEIRGRLYMPDGQTIDVVTNNGWGQPWAWIERGRAAGIAPVAAGHVAGAGPRFEGFNLNRAQDPQKSAKDAFLMLARQAGSMPLTKPDAEAWFKEHIKAGMESLGYTIHWVQGDTFRVTAREGVYDIDFVRGAGGADPALAWQARPAA